jgi:dimethylamine monooxygenase subunit A
VTDASGYVPLDAKPWRLAMGLRPLPEGRWIEVDGHRAGELALKQELLTTRPGEVVAALPGSEAASAACLELLVADLERHHPGLVRRDSRGRLVELTTGTVVDTASLHPLDAAGRIVQEDLCLMGRQGEDTWRLVAASLCFPSRWRLTDKIGRDLSGIHAPVPGYEDTLARPTSAFFDRIKPDRPVWRLNWTLIDHPDLHQPDVAGRRHASAGGDPGRDLWFRVERQTLRRLEAHPAVLFTIRTFVTPLGQLVDTYPETVDALLATLPTVPQATLDYKGWGGLVEDLMAWLLTRG